MTMNQIGTIAVSGVARESAVRFRADLVSMIRVIEREHRLPTVLVPPKKKRNASKVKHEQLKEN